MDVTVSVAVMTHPRRLGMAHALAARLDDAQVVVDPDPDGLPSPWRTNRHALELTPDCATHRLVLQDDVTPCRGFDDAACAAVNARPDRPIAFFHAAEPQENLWLIDQAASRGQAWADVDAARWIPAVALCWPVRLIRPVLDFVDAQGYPQMFRADDEIFGRALRALGVRLLVTVPSLVEHDDTTESLMGRRAWGGEDKGRVAHRWIGDGDATLIDWIAGSGRAG